MLDRLTGAGRFGDGSFFTFLLATAEIGLGLGVAGFFFSWGRPAIGMRLLILFPSALFLVCLPGFVLFVFIGHSYWWSLSYLALVIAALRYLAGPLIALFPDPRRVLFGSASWSGVKEAAARGRIGPKDNPPVGFALGRLLGAPSRKDGRLFHLGHVLTVAPTGAGKGTSAVIPNLLDYPGSAFVLDFKGENFAITARIRAKMGHDICLIDPFFWPETRRINECALTDGSL